MMMLAWLQRGRFLPFRRLLPFVAAIQFDPRDVETVRGFAPLMALLEWYELHRDELLADWQFAERHLPLVRIPSLE